MTSIRRKLLVTLIGALLAACFGATAATFFSAQAEFNEFLDTHLKETAHALAQSSLHDMRANGPKTHMTIVGDAPSYQIIIQVYDSLTNSLWHRENSPTLPLPDKAGFLDVSVNGKTWRTYSTGAGPLVITVAQDLSVRTALAEKASFHMLQPLTLLIPLIALAVWIILGTGLAPLEKTARSVSRRSPTSLKPLSTKDLPLELYGLVNAINQLLTRLNESLTAQQRFASDAAHELRTPLTALKLQVQLAQRAKTPEAQQKCFIRLNEGINRATRLVEQLLTLARLDPEAMKKPAQTVRLDLLAQSVKEDLTPIAQEKSIEIQLDLQPCAVDGLEDALRLLITNLTDNAIRYTGSLGSGHILLQAQDQSDTVVISVSDDGPGIAPEERERIFDRFYRALGTKTSGTGLGLAIVKRIIDIHHGKIQVSDGINGKGTAFIITFPKLGINAPLS